MRSAEEIVSSVNEFILHPLAHLVGHRGNDRLKLDNATDYKGIADAIANQIAAENKHVELRFQWNLGLQGFLYASYAIAIGQSDKTANMKLVQGYADIVAVVGMMACGITLVGLYAAYRAINKHKMNWITNSEKLQAVSARPFSDIMPSLLGRLPSVLITMVLLWGWFRLDKLI